MRKKTMPATLEDVLVVPTEPPPVTRRRRTRTPIVIPTNDPPILFTEEDYALFDALGLRVFQVVFPMLGSINEQYETKTGQAGMHTKETFRKRYNRARKIIQEHVKNTGWTPDPDDRYILVFDFSYRNEILQDIDGPRKASGDILQPMTIPKEKRKEMTPEQIAAWYEQRPYVIWNDNRVFEEIVVKHTNQPRDNLLCVATVYAFHKQHYVPIPLHRLLLTFLINHVKGRLPSHDDHQPT